MFFTDWFRPLMTHIKWPSVTHTEPVQGKTNNPTERFAGGMKYLVWLGTSKKPVSQLWSEDYTVKTRNFYKVLRKVELKGTETHLSLNALSAIYPCPEEEKDA